MFQLCLKEKNKRQLNSAQLVKMLKDISYNKEETVVVVENVSAMPGQGVTSIFNLTTFGAIKGICAALGLPIFLLDQQNGKHFDLINSSKDASRTKAIEMYPYIDQLSKKDVNKSDAILIARFYSETRLKED